MMRFGIAALILGATLSLAGIAPAQEHAATSHAAPGPTTHRTAEAQATEADALPPPVISDDGSWAGAMVIIILLGFFLPAWVIGSIVHTETPEEVPPAHSHDEPPGASHHHGPGGTYTEDPHD
jgi:hypothetical protein